MIEPQCPTCKALHAGFWLTDKGPAALHPYLPQPQAAAWHCSALGHHLELIFGEIAPKSIDRTPPNRLHSAQKVCNRKSPKRMRMLGGARARCQPGAISKIGDPRPTPPRPIGADMMSVARASTSVGEPALI